MVSRYLILLAMLVFPGLIAKGQYDLPLNLKQVSINPDLIIHVGAFRQESKSLVLKEKLSPLLDKPVILIAEGGFFKVRITGFSSQEEMENLYPTLAFLGLKNFWVSPVKKQEEINPQAVVQSDTIEKPESKNRALPVVAEEKPEVSQPAILTLQNRDTLKSP